MNDFAEKPLELIKHLKMILGEIGLHVLEKAITSEMREKFRLEETELELDKAIALAKQSYLRASL